MFWASKNECEIDEFIGKYDCSIRSRSVNVYVSLLLGFEDSTRNCNANIVIEIGFWDDLRRKENRWECGR